jgi:hypothetical protein
MSAPVCSICNKPIVLETSKVDEDGKAVHEDCYVKRLLSAQQNDPPAPQHNESISAPFRNYLGLFCAGSKQRPHAGHLIS